ncbi:MAG: hypothetical protein A3F42_01320 [Gammaproteobacteria bacterium RIFCSPHIGHO2_12_FULL_37_34]|nr:MAG: hypothetical protein A3F42_01320 [Gammaproteobacteria bacterium RIFCSPHIGHO2_12_FULL_37_34]
MRASILDLRYHMKEILQALERNETIEILYHGKHKGILIPPARIQNLSTQNHPYFGMVASKKSVAKEMEKLRGGRYK